jgi:putative nucleotidyltransferase with HDIG domain
MRRAPSRATLALWAYATPGVIASVAALISWRDMGWPIFLSSAAVAFPLFITVGDLLEIPLERRSIFSLGLAPALAFALLRRCGETSVTGACLSWTSPHVGEVVEVLVLGSLPAPLLRLARRRKAGLAPLFARLVVVLSATAIYRVVLATLPDVLTFGPASMSGPGIVGMLIAVVLLDVSINGATTAAEERLPFRQVAKDQFRATWPLLVSSASVGALVALAYPVLRGWTLALFVAPLAATHYSFRQVSAMRRNYLQTVRALSKVPEMAGYTAAGHSVRVAKLAVEMATELGIGDAERHEIEYAALLHDIGRISLPDPEDLPRREPRLELALIGAEIVEKTGHFPAVARMVRQQYEPYRRPGEDANRDIPIGARIIKVASAYDDLTEPSGPGRTPWDALERLHLGMAYEYDPRVIQALTRVLEKRGLI